MVASTDMTFEKAFNKSVVKEQSRAQLENLRKLELLNGNEINANKKNTSFHKT